MRQEVIEIGLMNYVKVREEEVEVTEAMGDFAEMIVFAMQSDKEELEKSRAQIEQFKANIKKGDKLPPITIEVNHKDEFVTITDGLHRTLAYRQLGVEKTRAIFVRRWKE